LKNLFKDERKRTYLNAEGADKPLKSNIPEAYIPYRYSLAAHGVGMADEWPVVLLHPDFGGNHGGRFETDMVICVESLVAEKGSESIKLETQVLVTETGVERLDSFPWG
jgi:Xaa-Pro aminopeptidase